MELEIGKSYKNRKGEKITIISFEQGSLFPFIGKNMSIKITYSFTKNGSFNNRITDFDLISLWEEEFTPKRGDRVLVWNNNVEKTFERIFLADIKGSNKPIIVVLGTYENEFLNNKEFMHIEYKNMKPIPEKEEEFVHLTFKDISEGKGVGIPPHLIRIKK